MQKTACCKEPIPHIYSRLTREILPICFQYRGYKKITVIKKIHPCFIATLDSKFWGLDFVEICKHFCLIFFSSFDLFAGQLILYQVEKFRNPAQGPGKIM